MSADGVPEERQVLTLGATGHRRPASVYDSEAPLDFFDLKGDLETILGAFDLPALAFQSSERTYFQQGRSGRMSSQGAELAVFGLIQQDLAREYKLRQEVWVAEIDFERLLDFSPSLPKVSAHLQVSRGGARLLSGAAGRVTLCPPFFRDRGLGVGGDSRFLPRGPFPWRRNSPGALQPFVAGHFSEPRLTP